MSDTVYAVSLEDVLKDAGLSQDQARIAIDALRGAGFGIYPRFGEVSDEDRELYRQDVESGEASDPRNGL